MRVGGTLAREVSSVKLGNRGVEVLGVEPHTPDDPVVGTDLNEVEYLGVERRGVSIRPKVAGTHQDQPLAADRNHRRRHVRETQIRHRVRILDRGLRTTSAARVRGSAAIVTDSVGCQHRCHRFPVAGRKVRPKAVVRLACRVFQL